MDLVNVPEEETTLSVPEHEEGAGPKSSDASVFYNPAMKLSRDIGISFLRYWLDGDEDILDGMAATGARGIRIANELECNSVVINDVSREAFELIQKNIDLNGLKNASASNMMFEENLLQNRYRYEYIDIDPFGSPVAYYPLAARFVSGGGIIGVTATDTAVLCGTYPKTCWRKYSGYPLNNWCRHEIGLRILMGFCAREAARVDRGIRPLLSYYEGHHFRSYFVVEEGAKIADSTLNMLKTFNFDEVGWKAGGGTGPLWAGDLFSERVVENMEPVGELDEDILGTWRDEADKPLFFYDTNIISKSKAVAPPPMDELMKAIEERDHSTSFTHFTPTGIKTDAPRDTVLKVFDEVSTS